MDQELVPDQDMPSDNSFEQAVRDEGDVADTAATEIKTARSKESKKTGGENMEALVEGGRSVKVGESRYETYCNVRQGFVILNFSGPLKLKRPWVTLSTTRTSAIPGMK